MSSAVLPLRRLGTLLGGALVALFLLLVPTGAEATSASTGSTESLATPSGEREGAEAATLPALRDGALLEESKLLEGGALLEDGPQKVASSWLPAALAPVGGQTSLEAREPSEVALGLAPRTPDTARKRLWLLGRSSRGPPEARS